MCNLNGQCSAKKGLCIHEKIQMMGGMMVLALAAIAHWVLRWF
jgi:hypothetical protein